ncbi:response regulator [Chamaesiphon minutus]|uniref:Response regulator with CheY-like receiver domain and winged-helix DNA-binding domain n=1 Tax=Chamaesiphon minutus (strain ATCC 27169 / PCC 6605) TaxID=1173020 RepID=K9UL62_CHAP6|nr:response regulator [Chamaesiphon minutus]AFY95817.1 response regulator with CheY-like receiver domain and winged-helix DNA-binding domain [Chamaesiphon minutus PCC 6605]
MSINSRPIEVLLVEDNPGDVHLTRIALADREVNVNLSVVADGVEAINFLHCQGEYHHAVHPDLILLDWNLPRKNGPEVLIEIKADERLQRIPVVVLTTSQAEEDILRAYNLHANCYITKPVDFNQFVQIVQSIEDFWFSIVQLPPQ